DHLGSPRVLTNGLGTVTGKHHYYPYGTEYAPGQDDEQEYKYTGHQRDTHGLSDYMRGRTCAFPLQRFMSVDPGRDGWNLYAYGGSNPLRYVDPSGRVIASSYNLASAFRSAVALAPKAGPPAVFAASYGATRAVASNLEAGPGITVDDVFQEMFLTALGDTEIVDPSETMGGVSSEDLGGTPLAAGGSSGGGDDGGDGEDSNRPLLGQNPRFSNTRTNTDLPGGRAAARSIFRNQTRGQPIESQPMSNGGVRQRAPDGTQLRMNPDGSTRLDLPGRGPVGRETIHFSPTQ
ncbi:MAG: RHS repeat-associated core domain-containing protein, partial [Acidobacteriota bacterium]|nr:RHS repeat-associated core domain-containing protein [Acidobacteriota bacterium]